MSIFFLTGQRAQRPNIEIKQSLVSLLTAKSFLECRLPGIISRLALERSLRWRGWDKRMADQATKRNIRIQSAGDFMPGPRRWKALWNTSLLAKNTVKRLLMN